MKIITFAFKSTTIDMKDMTFTEAKNAFDAEYGSVSVFTCFLSVHQTFNSKTSFRKKDGSRNEQYYKWQYLFSIVHSGLFPKDFIGTEVRFPKGNKSSADIILDAAIFSDATWFDHYCNYHHNNSSESLDWLRKHLIAAIEIKKEDNKNIAEVWDKQLKAYLKESEDTSSFTLDDFIEKDNDYNSKVGIYELDKTAKYLKEKLNKAIDDVVNDKKVMMEFS